MGERNILYAIAESRPFDILLVREMKRSVDSLLQLNLRRFRVPQQNLAKYSALDIVKQALELLFEFSPSAKNYREAMRTIAVYSEGDAEMRTIIQASFRLIANAVYNAYTGQRQAESIAPKTLFLQGVRFEPDELQRSFRFVGVKPPEIHPPSAEKTIFLDEGFEPYSAVLEEKVTEKEVESGRWVHWLDVISGNLSDDGKNLLRAKSELIDPSSRLPAKIFRSRGTKLLSLLSKNGLQVQVVERIADVNQVYGK